MTILIYCTDNLFSYINEYGEYSEYKRCFNYKHLSKETKKSTRDFKITAKELISSWFIFGANYANKILCGAIKFYQKTHQDVKFILLFESNSTL